MMKTNSRKQDRETVYEKREREEEAETERRKEEETTILHTTILNSSIF